MNLGPAAVNLTYRYLLNQSGTNITLGDNTAVNWNGANVVARTGDQTISGIKTFTSNILALSFGNLAASNSFGDSAILSNSFGANTPINSFGEFASTSNSFGDYAEDNTFGDGATNSNSFGFLANENFFGSNAAVGNNFGDAATTNYFGYNCSDNHFGGGVFESGIRVLLPEFDGDSSQAGQFGELRISGSGLYVCTGTTGGWRRIFLQSF